MSFFAKLIFHIMYFFKFSPIKIILCFKTKDFVFVDFLPMSVFARLYLGMQGRSASMGEYLFLGFLKLK